MAQHVPVSVTFGMLNDGDTGRGGAARTQRCSTKGGRGRTPWPWQPIACTCPTTSRTWRPQWPTPLVNVGCLGANRLWYLFCCRHFFLEPTALAAVLSQCLLCRDWVLPSDEFHLSSILYEPLLSVLLVDAEQSNVLSSSYENEQMEFYGCAWMIFKIILPPTPPQFSSTPPSLHTFKILKFSPLCASKNTFFLN